MSETAQSLSLERKIKMHEARESIIERLALDLPTTINLDRFLRVIVSELGRMMNVDRCDVIQLTSESELRISHEWRADDDVPSSLGTAIPLDLKQLADHVDITKPIRLDDTAAPGLDHKVRFLAKSLGTRSLLVVPVIQGGDVLGLIGLHHTRTPRAWLDEEVAFLQSIARQLAIGYQYTRLYTDKKREADTTNALLEIANDINTGSDFNEVIERILDRSLDLLRVQAACLAIIDANNSEIHFTNLRTANGEVISPDGRRFSYGDLVGSDMLHVQAQAKSKLKDPATFKVMGQPIQRVDIACLAFRVREHKTRRREHAVPASVCPTYELPEKDGIEKVVAPG